ncbi:hypothetical protein BDZ97DRAFT_1914399 [Flammula alnicola]|nr:hypothetical protein BDZ97DRAFT_1914399 [Flammula alnicola]
MGQDQQRYTQSYSIATGDQVYDEGAFVRSVQSRSYDGSSRPYEQERLEYDPRPWRRQQDRRGSPVYEEYHGPEDTSGYSKSRNYGDEWLESERHQFFSSTSQSYSHRESWPSEYPTHASHIPGGYDGYPSSSRGYHPSSSGYSDYRRAPDAYPETSTSGYSSYRQRPPADAEYHERATYPTHQHRSASPPSSHTRGFASQARPHTKPFLYVPPSPIRSPPRPALPRRTEPTEEYLSISLQSSPHLSDPTISRKLIVLDLNGSLVLRSAHQRRAPVPRHRGGGKGGGGGKEGAAGEGAFDPYADPTQLRPLRTVFRRPYLTSFTSYILHDETKKWLDTMVWSSAQPHSVDDMVNHCFGERRAELKAVWARDTLGLSGDEYNKKTQTTKDLSKPWEKISSLQTSSTTEMASSKAPHETPQSDSTFTETTADTANASEPQRHSAMTTLLVDDSPAKAALQPWNHLCIREYVQEMRNLDLIVADWEAARDHTAKTRRDFETLEKEQAERERQKVVEEEKTRVEKGQKTEEKPEDEENEDAATVHEGKPHVKKVTREVVMVDGEMVNREEVVKRVVREVVMIQGEMVMPDEHPTEEPTTEAKFVPNQRRKFKRLAKKEQVRKAREEKEREAFLSLQRQQQDQQKQSQLLNASYNIATMNPQAEGVAHGQGLQADAEKLKTPETALRYDEMLLAVIGVLDHLKSEGNVAGWMRGGGLLHTALPFRQPRVEGPAAQAETPTYTAAKHSPPSRGQSPSETPSPAKRRRVEPRSDEEEVEIQPPPRHLFLCRHRNFRKISPIPLKKNKHLQGYHYLLQSLNILIALRNIHRLPVPLAPALRLLTMQAYGTKIRLYYSTGLSADERLSKN